jgi:hypothetical protein
MSHIQKQKNMSIKGLLIKSLIYQQYVITQNEDDFIPFGIIRTYLKNNQIDVSDTKLGRELTKLGMDSKLIKIDKKTVRCRTGIKTIE